MSELQELRNELKAVSRSLEAQISEVLSQSAQRGSDPYKLMDAQGNFVLAPLLIAKADVLITLLTLEKMYGS